MIYKNLKDVCKFVSESKGLDTSIVRPVLDFYWGDIVNRIRNLENREIYINKIGSLRFRNKKGLAYIEKVGRMDYSKNPMIDGEKAVETIRLKKEKIEKLLEEYKLILADRIKLSEKKHAYRNIQKQNANLGRAEEQDIQG